MPHEENLTQPHDVNATMPSGTVAMMMHAERTAIPFDEKRGMAFCGLACAGCSDLDCPGCHLKGCQDADHCEILKCCTDRHLDGCHACDDFPCGAGMFQKPRVRAFVRCMREDGKANVLDGLRRNAEAGIAYHRANGLTGDYDIAAEKSEEAVIRMIRYGLGIDPYTDETPMSAGRFTIRRIRADDAGALMACYSDPLAWPFFNEDNCSGHFMFTTREVMDQAIQIWTTCHDTRQFARYTLLDAGVPFGTVEFCPRRELHPVHGRVSIVRADVDPAHERSDAIQDILGCVIRDMMPAFRVDALITKAVPQAEERIAALGASGFRPTQDPSLSRFEHYFLYTGDGA